EARRASHLATRRQLAPVADAYRGGEQAGGVEVEHRLRVRLVTRARIVAAQQQQVFCAERGGGQQVPLQGDAVAVAAGELQYRLDAVLQQDRRRRDGAEMRARAGAVGDVDGVGEALERQRLVEHVARIARGGRRHLGGDGEAAGLERRLQARRGAA